MMLSRREKTLIVILIIMAIFYGYYLYLYNPLKVKIANLVQENQQLNAVAVLGQQYQPTSEAQLKRNEKMHLFERLNEQVPNLAYVPESISLLEAVAENNNVELLTVDYKDDVKLDNTNPDNKDSWKECDYLINVGGEYQNLLNFLHDIEKSKRIYNIEKATISVKQVLNIDNSIAPESSSNYDGNKLILTLAFKSYYDEITWEGVSNNLDNIKPYAGRNNPFITE